MSRTGSFTPHRYQRYKKYCIPCVKVVVEAVTANEATGDSAVFDDLVLVPVAVVDISRTVVSGAEIRVKCYNNCRSIY